MAKAYGELENKLGQSETKKEVKESEPKKETTESDLSIDNEKKLLKVQD